VDITAPRAASLIRDAIDTAGIMVVGALLPHILSSRLRSELLWGEAGNYDHFITAKFLDVKAANRCRGDNGHLSSSRALFEELTFASLKENLSTIYLNRRPLIGFARNRHWSHCTKTIIQSIFPRPTYDSL
jgi:hypothetical protein